MDRNKWILVGAAVVVVVIVVAVLITRWAITPGSESSYAPPTTGKSTSSATVAPVPANAVVYDVGATGTPANVAVPQIQAPSAQNDPSAQYRSYGIKIENGQFTPDTVVLNYGDVIDLEITAVDGNYDFTQPDFGWHSNIAKGATQRIQGSASAKGKFTFYCKSCGGPSKGPVGYIIIK